MKKPIIVNSSVEFVVVGPIMSMDGIIIQSSNVGIDLIGAAYRLYRSEDAENANLHVILNYADLDFAWGKIINPNDVNSTARKYRMLFCWKRVPKPAPFQNNTSSYIARIEKNSTVIKSEFDKFIENSYSVLKNYSLTTMDDARIYEIGHSIIVWNIASLLLECTIDNSAIPGLW